MGQRLLSLQKHLSSTGLCSAVPAANVFGTGDFTDSIFIDTVTDLRSPAFFILLSAVLPNSRYFKLSVTDCTDDGLNKHKHIKPRRYGVVKSPSEERNITVRF
jgi:hypothetical protein